ncbi:NADH-quinone oxidoreductase subunit N [Geomonas sp. RF6]|uniref:NADH-quinone oxidoreductase subunit N n=1 Tax=Geomonas sp. RF6 TaxID=2897342 RepID=UPI001E3611AD|nr:NADH-quinone oxidoreductase subunit N [Geomonas sp. RF6]UFS69789.1 NADH-quinone oxidoreductase subunit N [Geomonas sp. RF6]
MQITLLLPEIALSLMVLVLFATTLGKFKGGTLNLLALALSAVSLFAAVAGIGANGVLFYDAYRVDALSQIFKVITTLGLFLVISSSSGLRGIAEELKAEYYLFLSIGSFGLVSLASSVELLTILMSLEISAFALYVIIPFRHVADYRNHMEAAVKYFLFGTIATGLMLFGMSYIFGVTGTTYLAELAKVVPGLLHTSPLVVVGMVLLFCGFFYKLALFPLHFLAPDVYTGAANETTSFIATVPKATALAVLIRLAHVTGAEIGQITWVLAVFAVGSMTLGNLSALVQKDLKRLLAYSSVAHAGYVMVGVLSANELGLASVIYYIGGYLLMNLSCFYVIYQLAPAGENLTFDDLKGLYKRSPLLAFVLAAGAFGMTGIPPTIGFTGKLLVFTAAIQKGFYALVILGVINAAISAFYYLKLVRASYSPVEETGECVCLSMPAKVLGVFFIASIILTGVLPQSFIAMAKEAVAGMI